MNEHASGSSERELIRAIESNGEEFLLALGRAAGAEERDDGRIRWVIGNCPIDYHNCVVRADLSPEETDGMILASLERFRAHKVPGSWHVGPSMRPPDLGERLLALGSDYGGDDGLPGLPPPGIPRILQDRRLRVSPGSRWSMSWRSPERHALTRRCAVATLVGRS